MEKEDQTLEPEFKVRRICCHCSGRRGKLLFSWISILLLLVTLSVKDCYFFVYSLQLRAPLKFLGGGQRVHPRVCSSSWRRCSEAMDQRTTDRENDDRGSVSGIDSSIEHALKFARTDPDAVVLSLWPSAIEPSIHHRKESEQIRAARSYLGGAGATILHEESLEIPCEGSLPLLLVMAAYWGEDWLETNCWYGEQPLEELGLPRPTGSWPGAKWKKELCFRQVSQAGAASFEGEAVMRMHVFVARVPSGNDNSYRRGRIWSEKYSARASMARETGHAGNSCMHLTDDQSRIVNSPLSRKLSGGRGMDCNASYAFCCARLLLNPMAMKFLVDASRTIPRDQDLVAKPFLDRFARFCEWLGDRDLEDVIEATGDNIPSGKTEWNCPPI